MDEFRPDEESVARAEKLSIRFMEDVRMVSQKGSTSDIRRDLFSEKRYRQYSENLQISDVVANVSQMASDFALAHRWDGEVACLRLGDGDLAPISMTALFGGSTLSSPYFSAVDWFDMWERYGPFPMHLFWREVRRQDRDERIKIIDVESAMEGTERSLSKFLAYRIAGLRKDRGANGPGNDGGGNIGGGGGGGGTLGTHRAPPGGAGGSGDGLQVIVNCRTPGLRIHISPAYFVNWTYFGSPTTPVISYVYPGRYIFAGDGPMLPVFTEDAGIFSIPPTYHPTLVSF